jgi:hypothetical protein
VARHDIDAAVDTDLILKATCYGLADTFWPAPDSNLLAVLGAARYVVLDAIARKPPSDGAEAARARLASLLARCEDLEPSETEIDLASELEVLGLRLGLALDTGEAQLAALVAVRQIPRLETGDKRAIASFEQLDSHCEELRALRRRVRCLEQIVAAAAGEECFAALADSICAEPGVDRALSICFSCFSGASVERNAVLECLSSYVEELRNQAPLMLAIA